MSHLISHCVSAINFWTRQLAGSWVTVDVQTMILSFWS